MTDQTAMPDPAGSQSSAGRVSRRSLFRAAGVGAAVVGGGSLLEACSSGLKGASGSSTSTSSSSASAGTKDITIAFVHPLTGDLAEFGTADTWIVQQIQATSQFKSGMTIGGKKYNVNIISKDSQSDPTIAGQMASDAILNDGADLILTSSTPETANPVSTAAEKLGCPTVCGNVPWQSWYANLGGNPTPGKSTFKPKYVTMFFLGVNDLAGCFIPMWDRIKEKYHTNNVVGAAFPNDADGNAFRAAFPIFTGPAGYKFVDPPAYTDGLTNYSSMISTFKSNDCDFFTNAPLPPDFNTMWKQASQQGFKPKLATVAKVLLFPTDVTALGSLVNNVATDAWWTPNMPWTSSLTGQTCTELADAFQTDTGKQWYQSLSNYSLFEVAYAALKSVSDPHDKEELAAALFNVNIEGIAGKLNWTDSKNPAPGVVDTPCVGVQWKPSSKWGWSPYVVDNTLMPQVPLTGDLEPTNA